MDVSRDNQFFAAFLEGNQPLVSVAGEHKTTLREFVAWARSSRISTALQDFRDLFALREEMVSIQARTTAIAALKRIVETSYNQVEVRRAAVVLARFTTRPKPRPNNGPEDGPSNGPDDNPQDGPTPTQPTPPTNSPEPGPPEPNSREPNPTEPQLSRTQLRRANPRHLNPTRRRPSLTTPSRTDPSCAIPNRAAFRTSPLLSSPFAPHGPRSPYSRVACAYSVPVFSLFLLFPDSLIPRAAFSAFPDSRFATPDSRCLRTDSRCLCTDSRCLHRRFATCTSRCLLRLPPIPVSRFAILALALPLLSPLPLPRFAIRDSRLTLSSLRLTTHAVFTPTHDSRFTPPYHPGRTASASPFPGISMTTATPSSHPSLMNNAPAHAHPHAHPQAQVNGQNGAAGPRPSDLVPNDVIIGWLRDMVLIREFENRCAQAYQQAKIGGFCHLYTGQEAAAVGTIRSLNHDDPIITAYRDHGHALARGMSPEACMAEMFGKITGCAKGKGGSMHMFDKPNWLFGGHGIVGAQTPVGTGLAFAARYEWEVMGRSVHGGPAKKKVALAYLGDGALNQGALHEAMNLAGLYSIPVIYVVENNGYSMGTSIERGTTMAHDLRKKADAYGIEGMIIDGFDIRSLYDHFKPLVDRCREEQRPAFVDLKTYRYLGHSMSDPQKYRTKDEVDQFKHKDSIDNLAAHLMAVDTPRAQTNAGRPILNEQQFMDLQTEIKDLVKHAVEAAENAPAPTLDELYTDVLLNPLPNMSPMGEYRHGARNPLI